MKLEERTFATPCRHKYNNRFRYIKRNRSLSSSPIFYIPIIFNFSWDGRNTQEKWKTKVMNNFRGPNKVHYGKCGSGELKKMSRIYVPKRLDSLLKKCRGKLDCLILEMLFFIKEKKLNWTPNPTLSKQNYLSDNLHLLHFIFCFSRLLKPCINNS